MSKKQNISITFQCGDSSGDGYDKTRDLTIISNLSVDAVKKAYKKGCGIVGFDLSRDVATEYENRTIKPEIIAKMWNFESLRDYLDPDSIGSLREVVDLFQVTNYDFDADTFILLWLAIAEIGNNEFEFDIPDLEYIDVGGYGMIDC